MGKNMPTNSLSLVLRTPWITFEEEDMFSCYSDPRAGLQAMIHDMGYSLPCTRLK